MLNFLPSSISFYIILTLSILLAVVSVISVKNYRAMVEAESALVLAINANTDMVKAANLQKMSCDVNDTSVVELDKEKKVIQVSVDVIDKELAEMKNLVLGNKPLRLSSSLMMVCFLLTLSGCSTERIVTQNKTTIVVPPDSLLIDPCKAVPAGESLIELAMSYNKNVGCIGLYKAQMKKLRDNKEQQLNLYKK